MWKYEFEDEEIIRISVSFNASETSYSEKIKKNVYFATWMRIIIAKKQCINCFTAYITHHAMWID